MNESKLTVLSPDDATLEGLLFIEHPAPVLVVPVGSKVTINATVYPKDASNRKFTVSLTSGAVGSIVNNTVLHVTAAGEDFLTVASASNPEVAYSYHVLAVQKVTKVTITASSAVVGVGGQVLLTAHVEPANATMQGVRWESLSPRILTVDEQGVVTGVARGQGKIRATSLDGSNCTATISLNVEQIPTSIQLSDLAVTLPTGTRKTLKATVLPANANNKRVTWSCSDNSVATVNANGQLNPVGPGTCVITCASQADPNVRQECIVTVVQRVTRVSFTQKETVVYVGETGSVTWRTEPANATDPSVVLTSSNSRIATVDQDGTIHPVSAGDCRITAKTTDGSNKTAAITVHVYQHVQGVHMKYSEGRVGVEETITLTAELEPANATNKNMTWFSEDESIASVKGTRNKPSVRGHRWGDVTIYGITEDGGYETQALVHVGRYEQAMKITDLYTQDNQIKIVCRNESNMNITCFYFQITAYDLFNNPLSLTVDGNSTMNGWYSHTLTEHMTTTHGRFHFDRFAQPAQIIGRLEMRITGYLTDTGFRYDISLAQQPVLEYNSPFIVIPTPNPNEEEIVF